MDFNDTLDELNTTIGDSNDVTFSPEEKIRALQKAWNDSFVVKTIWDTTSVYDSTNYQLAIPDTMTTVKEIYISSSNTTSDAPNKIGGSLWEVVDGNIQFKNHPNMYISQGYGLSIKGNYKIDYSNDDTLDTTVLQEYVIALAGYNTLTLLTYKKANLFLKNDTSMAELITLKRDLKQEVMEARAKLSREFESV